MNKTFKITVDTQKSVQNPSFHVNTNDLRTVHLLMSIQSNGKPVNLEDAQVRIAILKPDKKTVFQDVVVVDAASGLCEVILDSQAYVVPGEHTAELMIYFVGERVSVTGRFNYRAISGILNDKTVESQNEYQAINKLVLDAETAAQNAKQAENNAKESELVAKQAETNAVNAAANALDELEERTEQFYEQKAAELRAPIDDLSAQLAQMEQNKAPVETTATKEELAIAVAPKAEKTYVDSKLSILDTKIDRVGSGSPRGVYNTLTELQNAFPSGDDGIYVVSADGKWYYWNGSSWVAGGVYQTEQSNIHFQAVLAGTPRGFNVDTVNQKITTSNTGYAVSKVNVGKQQYDIAEGEWFYGSVEAHTVFTAFNPDTLGIEFYTISQVSDPNFNKPLLGLVEKSYGYVEFNGPHQVNGNDVLEYTLRDRKVIENKEAILMGASESFNVDTKNEVINIDSGCLVNVNDKRFAIPTGTYDYKIPALSVAVLMSTLDGRLSFKSSSELLNREMTDTVLLGTIRRGTNHCDFNGAYSVNNSPIVPFTRNERDKLKPKFIITDKPTTKFIYDGINTSDITTITTNDIYTLFDGLVTNHSNYVSMNILGTETSGKEIRNYTFKPVKPVSYEGNLPKIIYIGNIHGQEKHIAPSAYLFFKSLCEDWFKDDVLRMLRHNVEFTIIPVLNPYGFDNTLRHNANGVDLNRNFSVGWTEGTVSDYNYGGSAPLSEVESQIAAQFMNDNSDAIYMIDHHNYGIARDSDVCIWYGSDYGTQNKAFLNALGIQIASLLQKRFEYMRGHSASKPTVSNPSDATMVKYWQGTFNKNGLLLETPYKFGVAGETWQDVQSYHVDVIGNTIAELVKNYDLIAYRN